MPAPNKTISVVRDEEHVISEAQGRRSREQILLDNLAVKLLAGTILGRVIYGALTATAGAWASGTGAAPGNSTWSAITVDAGGPLGDYRVLWTDATHFIVYRPNGDIDGAGVVAVAYNGSINFTITAGATPHVEDDYGVVTAVAAAGSGRYKIVDPAATDGTQIAAAVLAPTVKPTDPTSHRRTSAHVRDCEINGNKVAWPAGATDNQKAAWSAQLATAGVLIRY